MKNYEDELKDALDTQNCGRPVVVNEVITDEKVILAIKTIATRVDQIDERVRKVQELVNHVAKMLLDK